MAVLEINWNPSSRQLRQFAGLLAVFSAMLAGVLHFRFGLTMAAAVAIGLGATVAAAGAVFPTFMRVVYVAWMAAAFPIGWTISHLLLALIYYGMFTPIGLLMRLGGYDPMRRRFDRNAETYWIPRQQDDSPKRYFRQF